MSWTKEECLEALREADRYFVGSLSSNEFDSLDFTPNSETIRNKFGSWNEVKKEVGLEISHDGSNEPGAKQRSRMLWYFKKKEAGECSECGEDDPRVLQFHHNDPSSKRRRISGLVRDLHIGELEKELEKCRLLCSNCHAKEHNSWPPKLWQKFGIDFNVVT